MSGGGGGVGWCRGRGGGGPGSGLGGCLGVEEFGVELGSIR